jgi:hypothetical protein
MKIKTETFQPCTAPVDEVGAPYAERINGKVDVEIDKRGRTITCWARKYEDNGAIYAFGFMGRYVTSSKLWKATLHTTKNGNGEEFTTGHFGRDDRCGRFNKLNGMYFEPKAFFGVKK